MNEVTRLIDQLERAVNGEAWHGPSLMELLTEIDARAASSKPLGNVHTIWELTLHVEAWISFAADALQGKPMPTNWSEVEDWPAVSAQDAAAWDAARRKLLSSHHRLTKLLSEFSTEDLDKIVPGRPYDFFFLLHGLVQHNLYHAGQIAILASAMRKSS